ncbi:hypothetical protein CSAL01_12003 [Colletotrichum salicis]|uniref:Uncharacterized protein n=1 Tax=Colletotrichum salicis TaxID=1209931 RepID=A0A135V6X0_9PEZI|nr:hypothetical protein CSAL01_12003 [Colletotrichum salicis]
MALVSSINTVPIYEIEFAAQTALAAGPKRPSIACASSGNSTAISGLDQAKASPKELESMSLAATVTSSCSILGRSCSPGTSLSRTCVDEVAPYAGLCDGVPSAAQLCDSVSERQTEKQSFKSHLHLAGPVISTSHVHGHRPLAEMCDRHNELLTTYQAQDPLLVAQRTPPWLAGATAPRIMALSIGHHPVAYEHERTPITTYGFRC